MGLFKKKKKQNNQQLNSTTPLSSSEEIFIKSTEELNKTDGVVTIAEIKDGNLVPNNTILPQEIDIEERKNKLLLAKKAKQKKIRKNSKEAKTVSTITSLIVLVLMAGLGGFYYYVKNQEKPTEFQLKELHIELGEDLPTNVKDYVKRENIDEMEYTLDITEVNKDKVGEYNYYVTFMNYTRNLYFEFINEDSLLQFVALNFYVHRDYFTDPDTYKIELHCTQNINSDFQLITYDDEGNVDECNLDVYAVLYTTNTDDGSITPYRYLKSELKEFNEADAEYVMEFKFKTNDVISKIGTYMTITSGMYGINSNSESTASVLPTMYIKFFFCAKLDREYGRYYGDNQTDNFDDIVPGLDGYTLTNVYNAGELGIDIFYDYSDIQTSYIELNKGTDGALGYYIYKMPVVRYTWLNSESRLRYLFSTIDLRRRYIQNVLFLLEDSFGIDYKFFNTYGPSLMYNIQNEENIDRINLSLKFEIKFQMESDKVILSQITSSIKEYIEDINNISDLHMPNLITYITNIYREHIVYIKFIALNNYDSLYQSIYKNPEMTDDYFVETQTVPEFINVNTLNNDLPDIEFIIVS